MNKRKSSHSQQYKVTVGFAQVTVDACNRSEALSAARRKLSHDVPRLWDVIFNMDARRFQVDPVT